MPQPLRAPSPCRYRARVRHVELLRRLHTNGVCERAAPCLPGARQAVKEQATVLVRTDIVVSTAVTGERLTLLLRPLLADTRVWTHVEVPCSAFAFALAGFFGRSHTSGAASCPAASSLPRGWPQCCSVVSGARSSRPAHVGSALSSRRHWGSGVDLVPRAATRRPKPNICGREGAVWVSPAGLQQRDAS